MMKLYHVWLCLHLKYKLFVNLFVLTNLTKGYYDWKHVQVVHEQVSSFGNSDILK